jgi:hypothetical protein
VYSIRINERLQKIEINGTKKTFPRSISVIEGDIKESINSKNEIILENIKYGVVSNKNTLKLSFAKSKEKTLKIVLNLNNLIPYEKGERIRLEFIILKLIDMSSIENYEKVYKEAKFKIKLLKGE